jgi:uncharacterized protein (DUF488 family)
MDLHTIGFTKRSAEDFFETLRGARIERVLDIRLQNTSQLAGFTKKEDLPYLLDRLIGAEYAHEPLLAPEEQAFRAYRSGELDWAGFRNQYRAALRKRKVSTGIDWAAMLRERTVLLCSEPDPGSCHRSILVDHLRRTGHQIEAVHL